MIHQDLGALFAVAMLAAGCSDVTVINTGEHPAQTATAPTAAPSTPPSNAHLVNAFNYVAHVRLLPVTDGNRTFWQWECRFTTRPGEEAAMAKMVGEQVYEAGFEAIRGHEHLAA